MKTKIAILGSTGSIGKNLINIINKDKKKFNVMLLTTHKNYKDLLIQIKKFNVKNIIITDKKTFDFIKTKNIKNLNLYNNFNCLNKIFKSKIDYVMNSISGLDGLIPTLKIIRYTKKIAIANKESLICGWNLIKKKLLSHKTFFIPVDSEHFSIWFALDKQKNRNIEKIYITASGGPFLNYTKKMLASVTVREALKHPNWKMGKKISIDSATLINKVFEIIEAKNIFEFSYKKLGILIHKDSYIHALIKFNNGMIDIIAHDTNMKIPISNSLNTNYKIGLKTKNINIEKLNKLNLKFVDFKRFPIDKILKLMPMNHSLFETVLVSANDKLVDLFIKKKISFLEIYKYLFIILQSREFTLYKKKQPLNLKDIINLKKKVILKIDNLIK